MIEDNEPKFRVEYYRELNKALSSLAITREREVKPYIDKFNRSSKGHDGGEMTGS